MKNKYSLTTVISVLVLGLLTFHFTTIAVKANGPQFKIGDSVVAGGVIPGAVLKVESDGGLLSPKHHRYMIMLPNSLTIEYDEEDLRAQ